MEDEKTEKTSNIVWVEMLVVAIFFDLIQAGLTAILGPIIIGFILAELVTGFAILTFFVWFKIHNMSFASPKRFLSFGGSSLIEAIPGLNALPTWTAFILLMIFFEKGGDVLNWVTDKAGFFLSEETREKLKVAEKKVLSAASSKGKKPGAPPKLPTRPPPLH